MDFFLGHYDKEYVADFHYKNVEVSVNVRIYNRYCITTRYIARKLIHTVNKVIRMNPQDLDINEQHYALIQCLDSGGLIYPSN